MICKDRAVPCLTVQGTALRGPLTASCAFRVNTFAAQHKWAQTLFLGQLMHSALLGESEENN